MGEQDAGQEAANPNNAGVVARIASLNKQLDSLQAQYETAKRDDPGSALRLKQEIERLQAEIDQLFNQIQAGPSQDQRQSAQPATPNAEAARQAIRERQAPAGPSVENAKQSIEDWEAGKRPSDVRTASMDPAAQEPSPRSKRRKVKTPREIAAKPAVSVDQQVFDPVGAAQRRTQTSQATGTRVQRTSGDHQVAGTAHQQQR